jgi:hypothetical protein
MLLGGDPTNSLNQISEITGLNISVIKNILYGINHLDLQAAYPIEYAAMLSNKGNRLKSTNIIEGYPNVVSPEGVVYKVTNARQFALSKGLEVTGFHKLLSGKQLSHKNWKLK